MSKVTLTLREVPPQRLDVSTLRLPDLAALDADRIAALPLRLGNASVSTGDLFQVAVSSDSEEDALVVRDSCNRLDGLGAATAGGRVEIFGDAGAFLAQGMSGGRVEVHGNCGAYAGTEMAAGRLHVHGSAGDFAGAAMPGQGKGLQGGVVVIDGDVGARAADRMRRGLLLIAGDTGPYCGSRMVAGTVSVLGKAGKDMGLGMRRGTLLLSQLPAALPATFNRTGTHNLNFLNLFRENLSQAEYAAHARTGRRVQRWVGDRAVGGLGELLLWD